MRGDGGRTRREFLARAGVWRGEKELIHTIKSGFIVPLLVIGLGVLFLPRRNKLNRASGGAM